MTRLITYLSFVRFSHSVFALPFALTGALLATREHAITWVQVKYRWRMTMDSAERTALSRILSGSCGSRTVTIPSRAR